jgi:hypothetical protein
MAAFAAIVLAHSNAPSARAQEILRWKFREGDVLKYTSEQTTTLSIKIMGRERKQKRASTTMYTWTVKGVSEAGDADVVHRIDRLTMKIEGAPYMPFEFDSSSPKGEVPEPFEAEVNQLKAAVGAEFSIKMKPTGEIENIKIPEATLKKLRAGLPAEGGAQDQFSEQSLKEMMSQSTPPPFPQAALQPGKSWSSKPTRLSLPLGTLILDRTFTFQGPDPQNPKLMLIAMEGKVALEPAQDVTAKIRLQDGKGTISFDNEAGRLVSSKGTQKTEMVIAAQGQEIDQTTDTTSVMTLAP